MFANTLDQELNEAIDRFIAHADQVTADYWQRNNFTHALSPVHEAQYSDRWCKIVTVERNHDGTTRHSSVYGFVCLKDGVTRTLGQLKRGDIHKAASWKAPAKHARGSVFDAVYSSATPHGIVYL